MDFTVSVFKEKITYIHTVETLKQKGRGKNPLNIRNPMEQWQSTIYSFFFSPS